jgi:peptide/nickel transport system substrate-binding protein
MSKQGSYWRRTLEQRISRRRALQAAALGAAGLTGAAVVGCAGEEEEGEVTPEATEEVQKGGPNEVVDAKEEKPPIPGGTGRGAWASDPLSLDPQRNLSWVTDYFLSAAAYSRLYKYDSGEHITKPTDYLTAPDVAESYEVTPDHLQWTFKLRPDVKFHNKPPLNGRLLVAEDVVATYRRFIEGSGPQPQPARYAMILGELIDSVEAPDEQTVVFKMKVPYPPFLTTIASAQYLWILSREAVDGDIDPAKEDGVIGTGPWMLKSYEPAKAAEWLKNPDYFLVRDGVPLPYLDGYTMYVVPEYATQKAQFQAANIDALILEPKDVMDVVGSVPDCQITRGDPMNLLNFMYFGQKEPNPFKDERVRRAVSMAVDRDAILEAQYNISTLRDAGYEPTSAWHNVVPAGLTRWWLDPQSEEMGAAGQYYKYDPAEAKKLLAAAGYPDGIDTDYHFATAIYGAGFETAAEATAAYLREAGINPNVIAEPYTTYITTIFGGGPEVSGIVFAYETPFTEVDDYLWHMYNPKGARNHGHLDDPDLTQMVNDQRVEADVDKRREIIWDIQRYASDKMYYVPATSAAASGYVAYQRWVRNVGVFRTASFAVYTETTMFSWHDEDDPTRNL